MDENEDYDEFKYGPMPMVEEEYPELDGGTKVLGLVILCLVMIVAGVSIGYFIWS